MYAKIFAQIFDSSIAEDYRVRLVFEDMLKLANSDGVVDMTHESIARRTNVPLEIVRLGIEALEAPDARSRTPDHEGRRLQRLDEHRDWGWLIVNFHKFRQITSDEQRREKTRDRVARFKERHKQQPVTLGNAPVTLGNAINAIQKQKQSTEEEGEANKEMEGTLPRPARPQFSKPTLEMVQLQAAKMGLVHLEAQKFFNYYEANGWRVGRNPMKSWQSAMSNWKLNVRSYTGNGTAAHAPAGETLDELRKRALREAL